MKLHPLTKSVFIMDYFLFYLAHLTSARGKTGRMQSTSIPCVTLVKSLTHSFLEIEKVKWWQ